MANSPCVDAVISFSPPITITVPVSYSLSARYFSARSAYLADVAVPWNNTAAMLPLESRAAIL